MSNEDILKKQGILAENEQFETLYLADEEIEKFMEKYLKENPDAEIETRYINQPPVELTQNIEVRWLRPETPEIPPIIIKEVDIVEEEEPPLRIVQTRKESEEKSETVIIREKPPFIIIPEPKVAYVQNVSKRESNKQDGKFIKIEHVRSESQSSIQNKNKANRLEYEEQTTRSDRDQRFSFEEHASIIDYEEEFEHHRSSMEEASADERYRFKSKVYEDEQQLRLYEQKLKQTLYEEYLLRLERERLEEKISRSGLFEERLRERSVSQDRMSHLSSRLSNSRLRDEEQYVQKQYREQEMSRQLIRERKNAERQQSVAVGDESTSSYKNIKFTVVKDENELKRLNDILNNPNSLGLKSKADVDRITSSLSNLDQARNTTSSFKTQNDIYNTRQSSNMADGIANINEMVSDRGFRKEYQTSSSTNVSRNYLNKSSSGDYGIPRTESERRYLDDLRAYEMYNEDVRNSASRISDNSNGYRSNELTKSGNGSGVRRQVVTTIKKFYTSNTPASYSEKSVYVKNS